MWSMLLSFSCRRLGPLLLGRRHRCYTFEYLSTSRLLPKFESVNLLQRNALNMSLKLENESIAQTGFA